MFVEVQFSIYHLKEINLSPVIEKAINIIKNSGLPVEVGSMSSITYGDSEIVFKAFQRVYDEISADS